MYKSTLVIGATGMLMQASKSLANRSEKFTFTARTKRSIERMYLHLSILRKHSFGLQLDWNNETLFLASLDQYFKVHGNPSLVVAWLHNDETGSELAKLLCKYNKPVDFYHIRGSMAGHPDSNFESHHSDFNSAGYVNYHQIILGFQIEGGQSRWLSNSEISTGVLNAVEQKEAYSVVGTVEPWNKKP